MPIGATAGKIVCLNPKLPLAIVRKSGKSSVRSFYAQGFRGTSFRNSIGQLAHLVGAYATARPEKNEQQRKRFLPRLSLPDLVLRGAVSPKGAPGRQLAGTPPFATVRLDFRLVKR